jgi:magnesium transporter
MRDLMSTEVVRFAPTDKAADAAAAFERYDLVSAPVLNERGKLAGRLTVDSMVDFIREEAGEDVLNMAGLREEEDLFAPIWKSARNRGTWLLVNVATAFIASRVIGVFEASIAQLVALAALMPIIASVGGNTGNQTTALVIRGLAMGQIDGRSTRYLLRKEIGIGLLNGAMLGLVVGAFAYVMYADSHLALVMTASMLLTLVLAAIIGMGVPLILQRFGRDPALGSSVLLTAGTDSLAFAIFLGMATVFLL